MCDYPLKKKIRGEAGWKAWTKWVPPLDLPFDGIEPWTNHCPRDVKSVEFRFVLTEPLTSNGYKHVPKINCWRIGDQPVHKWNAPVLPNWELPQPRLTPPLWLKMTPYDTLWHLHKEAWLFLCRSSSLSWKKKKRQLCLWSAWSGKPVPIGATRKYPWELSVHSIKNLKCPSRTMYLP